MTSLKDARKDGDIDRFVAEHEGDQPGDKRAFDRTIQAMAGKSKAVPEASKPERDDG